MSYFPTIGFITNIVAPSLTMSFVLCNMEQPRSTITLLVLPTRRNKKRQLFAKRGKEKGISNLKATAAVTCQVMCRNANRYLLTCLGMSCKKIELGENNRNISF